jgi:hypothetical protein
VKSLALTLLGDLPQQWSQSAVPEAGRGLSAVLRYNGKYEDDQTPFGRVLFASTPYTILQGEEQTDDEAMSPLLYFHYGYQVGNFRENNQVFKRIPNHILEKLPISPC